MEAVVSRERQHPDPLAAVVREAAAGDRDAYGRLVEDHWAALVRLARSVVGDAEAEDAVQDTLLQAWGKLRSLRDPGRFGPWVSRMVVRACLRRARRRRGVTALDEAPEPRAAGDPAPEIDVRRLLALLAPRQRAVMHLTVVEGMSDGEIAAVMRLTAASVRSHRRRARQRLTRYLEGENRP